MNKFFTIFLAISLSIGFLLSSCASKNSSASFAQNTQFAKTTKFGFGTTASQREIAGWNVDIGIDGSGLPVGRGTAESGEPTYIAKCAACHGDFGEGRGRWPVLSGGEGSLTSDDPHKSIGSYWPYTTTLYDYIYRAMPYFAPQSLTPDEVYGVVAYILNMNDLIDYEFEVNQANLASIKLPNLDNFYPKSDNYLSDPRLNETQNWQEPCMQDCIDDAHFKLVESITGVTPDTEK